jgi:hypothetical protein
MRLTPTPACSACLRRLIKLKHRAWGNFVRQRSLFVANRAVCCRHGLAATVSHPQGWCPTATEEEGIGLRRRRAGHEAALPRDGQGADRIRSRVSDHLRPFPKHERNDLTDVIAVLFWSPVWVLRPRRAGSQLRLASTGSPRVWFEISRGRVCCCTCTSRHGKVLSR